MRVVARGGVPTRDPLPRQRAGAATGAPTTPPPSSFDTNPPRGTRDFPPPALRARDWLFDHFRAVSRAYGFEAFETPVLEAESLFTRKAGEEISGQLYSFEDRGGRRVALRPELTPSLARLVLAQGPALALPAKWCTVGQCWRYERTTRGRRREHYQWNMDIVGVEGVAAEAELLAAIVSFFTRVGLTPADVVLKVSSRKVLTGVMAAAGVPADAFGRACVAVDKLDKVPAAAVAAELTSLGITEDAAASIIAATQTADLDALAALLGDADGGVADVRALFALADAHGIRDWLAFDPSIVRGLAYYTGLVFEGRDRAGTLRAICGGGRYDGLLSTYGGPPTPCAGFGFGDCVIQELLADKGLVPALAPSVDDLIVPLTDALRPAATALAARLRAAGRAVDLVLDGRRMKWVFKHAERVGAARLVIVGEREFADGNVTVKDLAARTEALVKADELV
jgi:histidyl-tRNA synthetase